MPDNSPEHFKKFYFVDSVSTRIEPDSLKTVMILSSVIYQCVNIEIEDLVVTQFYQDCCHGSKLSSKTRIDRVVTPKRTSTYFISIVNVFSDCKSEQFSCEDDVSGQLAFGFHCLLLSC